MNNTTDYIELINKARLGNEKCLNRLCELASEHLRVYVYRLTLRHDLTQDIVQESVLEMTRFLNKLEKADRFWPWLRRIAVNRVYHQRKYERRHKTVTLTDSGDVAAKEQHEQGLTNLVSEELKKLVCTTMMELRPRYRQVLILRCYQELAYAQIAAEMQCTEFSARVLFSRAKRTLAKRLSRRGLGKSSLLMALALFGKMTAATEAAAAQVSVTAAATKVGLVATLAGVVGSKVAVVSLTAAGLVIAGTFATTASPDKTTPVPGEMSKRTISAPANSAKPGEGSEEYWYYYPSQPGGTVMMRLVKAGPRGKGSYCEHLQNEQANYNFNKRRNTIYINNYRMWRDDLSVWWLPTDSAELTDFIALVQGRSEAAEHVPDRGEGLLVVAKRDHNKNGHHLRITRHRNVLDEEYFRYDWPTGVKVVDNRDTMHKRGWTYFRITGRINQQEVSGAGCVPFVYETSTYNRPWLRLHIGQVVVEDNYKQARVRGNSTVLSGSYEGGSFFAGFARPWMGLHTMDTICRDAAGRGIWFESRYDQEREKVRVTLKAEQGKIVYTVNMACDVIEAIEIARNDGGQGRLTFSYLQDIDAIGNEFAEPGIWGYPTRRKVPGALWLLQLARNHN